MEQNYKEYKTWLEGVNSVGAPQVSEEQKQAQLASDKRIKKFVTDAINSDTTLSKMIGLGLLNAGYIDPSLAQIYILGKMVRG